MTEAEWQNQTHHAQQMAVHLQQRGIPRTKAGRRKLRLFACGCCRLTWDILPDNTLREAVQTAEHFAEGKANKEELAAARATVVPMMEYGGLYGTASMGVKVAIFMAGGTTEPSAMEAAFLMTATEVPLAGCWPASAAEAHLCRLFRCVFGNPFRPVALNPAWQTGTVVALAEAIYADRAFDRLPILADALEEAGCTSADLLNHCRQPGEHVRGCWAVDLLLGKA